MNKMAKLEHPPHARTAHLRSTSDLCNPASLKRTSPPLRLQIHPTPARWAQNSAMVPNRMTKSWMDKSPQLWNCLQVDVSAFTTCGGGGFRAVDGECTRHPETNRDFQTSFSVPSSELCRCSSNYSPRCYATENRSRIVSDSVDLFLQLLGFDRHNLNFACVHTSCGIFVRVEFQLCTGQW